MGKKEVSFFVGVMMGGLYFQKFRFEDGIYHNDLNRVLFQAAVITVYAAIRFHREHEPRALAFGIGLAVGFGGLSLMDKINPQSDYSHQPPLFAGMRGY